MDRRSLIKRAGIAGVLAAGAAPAVHAQAAVRWRLASSFPKSLDTIYGGAEVMAKKVKEMSGGKFEISVHAGGELMPPFGIVDGLQNGTVEMGHTVPYYYYGKNPAFALGSAIPFGFNARQMHAWMNHGDGRKLMNEFYAGYNMMSYNGGNTGAQMGGWYRKEIKSVADLKGLTMRTAGFAGEVLSRMGVVPQQIPTGDIYPALEKGALDAVEFVGPVDDEKLGFQKVAKYYYYPGWWEGSAQVSLYVNDKAYAELPKSYQAAVDVASRAAGNHLVEYYDNNNPDALRRLIAAGAVLKSFPREVMDASLEASNQVYKEFCDKDPGFKKIFDSYMAFRDNIVPWFRVAEGSYDNYLGAALASRKK